MSQDFMTDQEKILRKLLAERILLLDGAMGTMIQQHKLTEEDYRGGAHGRFAKFSGHLFKFYQSIFLRMRISITLFFQENRLAQVTTN